MASLLFVLAASAAWAASPQLWATLLPGPHAVGYLHLASTPQPMDVWYPAAAPGQPITFAFYLGARVGETRSFLEARALSPDAIARLLDSAMFATSEAPPRGERFPLIFVAQGNGHDAADQAILSEFIASHGYVVVSVPSPMIRQPLTDESQVAMFAESQADSLQSAMKQTGRIFRLRGRTGIIGHSFGARAALLLAMRRPEIGALVSLDGGIGTSTAIANLRRLPRFVRPPTSRPSSTSTSGSTHSWSLISPCSDRCDSAASGS